MTGGKAVRVVNTVGLEQYLWGVVPSEMPDTWPAEALKSQAIVARTYALTHLQNGSGDFDVYPDTRSQVYGGISAESAPRDDAVNGTAGQVVLYKGELAETFFFSSSGGRTANVQDVWGSKPTPYLVSVPDPYDTLSPYHDWGPLKMGALQLGKRLGLARDAARRPHRRRRRRPRALGDAGRLEGSRTLTGSTVRAALGLRSTWFTIGTLSLTPPAGTVEYGDAGAPRGPRPRDPRVTLERGPTAASGSGSAVLKSRGGQVVATLAPKVTTDYRTSRGIPQQRRAALGRALRAADRVERPAAVTGLVKPVLAGAAVADAAAGQRGNLDDGRNTTNVTSDGAFEASVDLAPGTYRARVIAGQGFAAGLSPVLARGVGVKRLLAPSGRWSRWLVAGRPPLPSPRRRTTRCVAPVVPRPRHALDTFDAASAAQVRVGVIDTGVELGHPELRTAGRGPPKLRGRHGARHHRPRHVRRR